MLTGVAMLAVLQSRPSPDWLPLRDVPAGITHELVIPPPATSGPRLEISGRVLKADGRTPAAGVILYFHHTDARGIYPRPPSARPADWSYWHGALRGWLRTDAQGRYVLKTTRPAPYPGGNEPAHIHVYGLAPGSREGFYFSDIVFRGDPFLTESYWSRVRASGHQKYSGVALERSSSGLLRGTRDLVLPR